MTPGQILDEGRDADIRRALKALADFEIRRTKRAWGVFSKKGDLHVATIKSQSGSYFLRTLGVVIDGMRKRTLHRVPTGRPRRVGQPVWTPASPDWHARRGYRRKDTPTPTDTPGTG